MAAFTCSSKPHALAVCTPFQGHMHPMMQLCKKLVSAGFMVTFANTQANHERIKGVSKEKKVEEKKRARAGEEEEVLEEGGDLHLVSLEEGFSAEFESPLEVLMEVFKPQFKASVADLLARLCKKDPPVSLLVFDLRIIFVQDIAAKAGISSLAFWTQNAANFASNLLVAQGFQLPPDDSKLVTCLQGVPPFKRSEVTGCVLEGMWPSFLVDEYAWEPFKRIHEPTWIVLNTFEELEPTTLDSLQETLGFRALAIGPLVDAASFTVVKGIAAIDCVHTHLEWLQGHLPESVLYVAFGTVVTMSEAQLEELVLGLLASQQPIFWVFRPDLCRNSAKYTVEALSRRFQGQGLVVDWASQWQVLSHPAVGGFITHCGWNSALEGITAGVPMLAWPLFADQYLTGRCIEEQWGLGLRFNFEAGNGKLVSRIEIEKKVRELMQSEKGSQTRAKARALSVAARKASEEGGSSHRDLMVFMQGRM